MTMDEIALSTNKRINLAIYTIRDTPVALGPLDSPR